MCKGESTKGVAFWQDCDRDSGLCRQTHGMNMSQR